MTLCIAIVNFSSHGPCRLSKCRPVTPFSDDPFSGTRSPYGACRNASNPDYISGGSSSGSAVAVALGLVSFALGTDTAGSGRVPAAFNNLVGHKPSCGAVWQDIDVLLTPAAGTIYTIAEMQADPVRLNAKLGYYINFLNLLDLVATAVPAGFQANCLPFGVTLIAPARQDGPLLHLAARLHCALDGKQESLALAPVLPSGQLRVAVVGAHLSGLPLNYQLIERKARLISSTHTAPRYRLYALPDGKRPGLIRVEQRNRLRGVGVACFPLWLFRLVHSCTAGHRQAGAGRRQPRERRHLRGHSAGRGDGHYRVRQLAGLAK